MGSVNEEMERLRRDAESLEVAEMLNSSKPALARRFAIISKRAHKPDVKRKMPLADGAILVDTLIEDFKQVTACDGQWKDVKA